MTSKLDQAKSTLDAELQPLLVALREDYLAAQKVHTPAYKGGPNLGILTELVKMGWRKQTRTLGP